MGEMERVADQLKRAYEGPSWHGPEVLEVLRGVTAAQAAHRPIAAAHSIWEIVLHMATWEDVVRRRALGEEFEVSDAEDWPAVTTRDEAAWEAAKARLHAVHHALRPVLASLPESRLDEPLVPGGNIGYVQIHGVVQHDLYHAGQIAVLKKAPLPARRPNARATRAATSKTRARKASAKRVRRAKPARKAGPARRRKPARRARAKRARRSRRR